MCAAVKNQPQTPAQATPLRPEGPSFGVVVPFYNEERFLPRTLDSLLRQTRWPQRVLLVDNASTDHGPQLARQWCQRAPFPAQVIEEPTPGKVFALQRGCRETEQQWVVTCDADTYYPPHYLETAARLLVAARRGPRGMDIVTLLALPANPEADPQVTADRLRLARRYPTKCFTGGFGQIFRADVLRRVGSFDARLWPYVLMDHEIVHRMLKHGDCLYDANLWCVPDDRRSDRNAVRWTLLDRWLYRNLPQALQDWFFYSYLVRRFSKRGMMHLNLREQTWQPSRTRGSRAAD